ncbi:MAG: hypothetical protein H6674_11230 [Dehalococcoidia bacterium]|nr:hypothetical protein [Dehalococcoidia bacterium]
MARRGEGAEAVKIRAALAEHGSRDAAAAALGMSRTTLWRKMRELDHTVAPGTPGADRRALWCWHGVMGGGGSANAGRSRAAPAGTATSENVGAGWHFQHRRELDPRAGCGGGDRQESGAGCPAPIRRRGGSVTFGRDESPHTLSARCRRRSDWHPARTWS